MSSAGYYGSGEIPLPRAGSAVAGFRANLAFLSHAGRFYLLGGTPPMLSTR